MESVLEPGEIVLCTVDRIIGTSVFVKIHWKNKEIEGSIVTSEIAPGRIRNLRDYVVPLKKIVCKVLRVSQDRIELSLRRVTKKDEKEIKEKYSQEKSYESILKSVLGEKSSEVVKKILEEDELYNFFSKAKENPKKLEAFVGKESSKKIIEILNSQKQKKITLKKEIFLMADSSDGLEKIKSILGKLKDMEIKYLSNAKYSIKKESEDVKKTDHELKEVLDNLEKQAKSLKMEFSVLKR